MKKKDIMDNILVGHGDEFASRAEELNCLIYKNGCEPADEKTENNGGKVWQESRENISVQVWESKARIKVKVTPLNKKALSMKKLASVAVNAILEELKKED